MPCSGGSSLHGINPNKKKKKDYMPLKASENEGFLVVFRDVEVEHWTKLG